MRYNKSTNESNKGVKASVFIDYENLYNVLNESPGLAQYPDELIAEMLAELKRYLNEEYRAKVCQQIAVADFSRIDGSGTYIQQSLFRIGVESRFVSSLYQANASELQVCVDVCSSLKRESACNLVVILTGNRTYVPLVQHLRQMGHSAIVLAFRYANIKELPFQQERVFLEAARLLGDIPVSTEKRAVSSTAAPEEEPVRRKVNFAVTNDPMELSTLELIEEHFGQYEEVYLTPLLRKLSEVMGSDARDPKLIINALEDIGAVWLEKRRGFPYDYTVLLVDEKHPDVIEIHERLETARKSNDQFEGQNGTIKSPYQDVNDHNSKDYDEDFI